MGHLPTLGQILTSNQKKTNKIEPKGSILYIYQFPPLTPTQPNWS